MMSLVTSPAILALALFLSVAVVIGWMARDTAEENQKRDRMPTLEREKAEAAPTLH